MPGYADCMTRLILVLAATAALCACSDSGTPSTPMAGAPDVEPMTGMGGDGDGDAAGDGDGDVFGQAGAPAPPKGLGGISGDGDAPVPVPVPTPIPEPVPVPVPPTACPDGDADGVCDADDVCPGYSDALDSDGDGVPDSCDDFPMGGSADDVDGDGTPNEHDSCDGPEDCYEVIAITRYPLVRMPTTEIGEMTASLLLSVDGLHPVSNFAAVAIDAEGTYDAAVIGSAVGGGDVRLHPKFVISDRAGKFAGGSTPAALDFVEGPIDGGDFLAPTLVVERLLVEPCTAEICTPVSGLDLKYRVSFEARWELRRYLD